MHLRQRARPYIFSTAPDVAAMAGALAALGRLESEPGLVARLMENVRVFVAALAENGVEVSTESAIVPITVGDERAAVRASGELAERGFLVPAIRYPTVARGAARLRAAVQHGHAEADLVAAARAVAEVCRT